MNIQKLLILLLLFIKLNAMDGNKKLIEQYKAEISKKNEEIEKVVKYIESVKNQKYISGYEDSIIKIQKNYDEIIELYKKMGELSEKNSEEEIEYLIKQQHTIKMRIQFDIKCLQFMLNYCEVLKDVKSEIVSANK